VIYTLAGGDRGHEKNCGFSSCLLGQAAWLEDETRRYRGGGAIGGIKHGGDTVYWHIPHLKNLRMPLMLAQPGYFVAILKHFDLSLSRLRRKHLDIPASHFRCIKLGVRQIYT
jgi:hypothetical protein